ncbi:DUF998 domain-containing protein [Gracilibacillus sp. HCP3S3_G5_1]|uniref:DUF998 domain-containing protein n=1 Tax=unclassified Gracilibacillus TaxID=2625209 RepID=UPI003F8B92A5
MDLSYFFMMVITILALIFALFFRKYIIAIKIGFISWILLSVYFPIEYLVIQATTAPYNFLTQPMSDLGVTTCGINTHILAPYEVCSPYHLLMNWTFTVTGIVIFVGAICLQQFWPDSKKTKIATGLLVIFGLSYSISGIFPADVSFLWHTLGALPGMVVQIPALLLIGIAIHKTMPILAIWTYISTLLTTCSLVFLFYQPSFINLPGGLLQRILYGSIYLWMTVTAIVLWRKKE